MMGKVNDEELARSTPCHGYTYTNPKTKKDTLILYSDGIKGILKKDQIPEFCTEGIEAPPATERQKERLGSLADGGEGFCVDQETFDTVMLALDALDSSDAVGAKEELKKLPVCK